VPFEFYRESIGAAGTFLAAAAASDTAGAAKAEAHCRKLWADWKLAPAGSANVSAQSASATKGAAPCRVLMEEGVTLLWPLKRLDEGLSGTAHATAQRRVCAPSSSDEPTSYSAAIDPGRNGLATLQSLLERSGLSEAHVAAYTARLSARGVDASVSIDDAGTLDSLSKEAKIPLGHRLRLKHVFDSTS